MTEPNAHEQLPASGRHECAPGTFHAWASHTAKGCLAWVPDPLDDHAVCPCMATYWDQFPGDTVLDPAEVTK